MSCGKSYGETEDDAAGGGVLHEAWHFAASAAGVDYRTSVWRFRGTGGGPRVFLQAGLHAGEHPGMLVLSRLATALEAASADGLIRGDVTVIPYANPIGGAQILHGELLGRHDLQSGSNFNRDFPDLAAAIAEQPTPDLAEACANVEAQPTDGAPLEALRRRLLARALAHDVIIDCHADTQSLLHIFASPRNLSTARLLARHMGGAQIIVGGPCKGRPMEDAANDAWQRLATMRPDWRESLQSRCAMTLEIRGRSDVDPALARQDVAWLIGFLRALGTIAGGSTAPDSATPAEPRPLGALCRIRAPSAGIVAFLQPVGVRVTAGAPLAEFYDLQGARPGRPLVIKAPCDGILLSRSHTHLLGRGALVCKLLGDGQPDGQGELDD